MKITFDRYLDQGEPAVRIRFYPKTQDELKVLYDVEDALLKMGLSFDTGMEFPERGRDWMLDWSMENVPRADSKREARHDAEQSRVLELFNEKD